MTAPLTVSVTKVFDSQKDEDVATLSGCHVLPVGSYIVTMDGPYRVHRHRLQLVGVPTLWLDVVRAPITRTEPSTLPDFG